MPDRQEFDAKTIRIAAQRAAYLCSNPGCRALTTTAATGAGVDMIGEAAHIIAARPDGPRGSEPLDKHGIPSITSVENALWLCSIHHTQVDRHPDDYPVELLLQWKADIEAFTRQHLGRNPFQPLPTTFTYTPPLLPDPTELPDRSTLPPGSHLPYQPNNAFTGRQDEQFALAHHLLYTTQNKPTAITQPAALSGSGGIGKTQLAVEFCYRYGQYFYGVHWLHADQDLNPQLSQCGEKMCLTPWPDKLPEQVALTLQSFQRQPHRLVVLDNLVDPQVLLDLPEELRAAKLLITSRRSEYDPTLGVNSQRLELLPRPDSLKLLRKLAPRLEKTLDEGLDLLAERLGDYPLALHLAGMYLNLSKGTTPQSYLEKLDLPGKTLDQEFLDQWKKTNPTKYEHNAGEAFLLSWNQLDQDEPVDKIARWFFLAAGYCAPNAVIPYDIFKHLAGEDVDELIFSTVLDRLQRLGLTSPSDTGPLLHPLLAEFARLQDAAAHETILSALINALYVVSDNAYKINDVASFSKLLPHLQHTANLSIQRVPLGAALLDNQIGIMLLDMGDYSSTSLPLERALAIRRKVLGEKHPHTAISLNNLGLVFDAKSDYSTAYEYVAKALAIRLDVLGEKHPDTAHTLNNLGSLLRAMGKYSIARTYYMRALAIVQELLGENHLQAAQILNDLGSLLIEIGDYVYARQYLEQALAIRLNILGESHLDTAKSLDSLGGLLQELGDYPAARKYYERSFTIVREILGDIHPYTAQTMKSLGSLLKIMGDYLSARVYLEKALAIDREKFGDYHYATSTDLNNLGSLLQAMGEYPTALTYYNQALDIRQKILGKTHPGTATTMNNLATLQQEIGDFPAARTYYEQALAIRQEVLGKEHPETAVIINNLGMLNKLIGDYSAAHSYLEQALAVLEATLGPDHPNTKKVRANLDSLPKP